MRESYLAGAYWGCRPESAGECARRAETFFRLLSECHPSYTRWYEQASSPKRALQLRFEPTVCTQLPDRDGGPASFARTMEVLYQGLLGLAVLPESLATLA